MRVKQMRNSQDPSLDDRTSTNSLDDTLSKEEIFYTGKRNIEGYATLVSFFLPKLIAGSLNPSLINVDNHD